MSTLMLVNPRKRKPARRKATSKRKTTAKRRTSPVKRRTSVAKRRSTSAKRRTYKRNPSARGMLNRVLERQVKPAAVQAAGALAVDIAYGFLNRFIPAQFTEGPLRHLTRGVGAIGISAVAANFVKQSWANEMAKGSLTVVMHDAAKEAIGGVMPQLPLGYYSPAMTTGMGYYAESGAPSQLSPESGFTAGNWGSSLGAYVDTQNNFYAEPYDSSVE